MHQTLIITHKVLLAKQIFVDKIDTVMYMTVYLFPLLMSTRKFFLCDGKLLHVVVLTKSCLVLAQLMLRHYAAADML